MSEFSESFHLRADTIADAVGPLRGAKIASFVYPPEKGWASFVCPSDRIPDVLKAFAIEANPLVAFDYAADHGCDVRVYVRGTSVARMRVSFETSKPAEFDESVFVELGLLTPVWASRVAARLASDRGPGSPVGGTMASGLGLPRYEWFSYPYEKRRASSEPGRIEILADGTTNGEVAAPDADEEEEALEGPLYAYAKRVVDDLVSVGALDLKDPGASASVAEALVDALSDLDGASREVAVGRCLTDHELVEDIFADDAALRAALVRAERRGRGSR
jgi:hypothetical protein